VVLKRGYFGKESDIPGKFGNVVLDEHEKIGLSDRVRNEENIVHALKRRKAN
jgi:hypothetical protein